jgi:SAM-dependent methyltransferase
MTTPLDPLLTLRDLLLAEASRAAPARLGALAAADPTALAGGAPARLANALFAARADLAARLEAALDAPAPERGFPGDPAGDLGARLVRRLTAENQFLPVDATRVVGLVSGALRAGATALRTAPDAPALAAALAVVGQDLARDLSGLVADLAAQAAARGLGPGPVVSAEYAPELQLAVLGVEPDLLPEPILDLGCGAEARLVRALRARGKDARGIDRAATPSEGVSRTGWFDAPLAEASLGTALSHLAFSLHFLHHHLRPGDEAARYARRYMEILRALRPGGLFAYAPGLPFVEAHLPAGTWRVERTPVAIPRPPAPPGTPELPWYASRVIRLAR